MGRKFWLFKLRMAIYWKHVASSEAEVCLEVVDVRQGDGPKIAWPCSEQAERKEAQGTESSGTKCLHVRRSAEHQGLRSSHSVDGDWFREPLPRGIEICGCSGPYRQWFIICS